MIRPARLIPSSRRLSSVARAARWLGTLALVGTAIRASPAWAESLSATEAVAQAVAANPTLEASMHDLLAARHGLAAAVGARRPIFFFNTSGHQDERFFAAANGITRNEDRSIRSDTGVRYTMDGGAELEVGVQSQTTWRTTNIHPGTTQSVSIGPNYSGSGYLSARQPLLRGAGTDAVLSQVRQATLERNQAEHERDNQAGLIVFDVLNAYWELWYAQRALSVQQQSLESVMRQRDETRLRAEELGTAARIDVLRLTSEVASIRDAVALAETSVATRALELGRLLGLSTERAQSLEVVDEVPPDATIPSKARLERAAIEDSAELRALEAELKAARERARTADNADRPKLDLLASGSVSGLWTDDELPGLALPGGRPVYGAMIGLELELPLGEGPQAGEARQVRERVRAAEARFRARKEAIVAAVATIHAELTATEQQVAYATEAAEVAEELAQAEAQRLELGTTTSAQVVLAEQSRREAELRRLRAIVNQATTWFRQEQQVGSLLDRFAPTFRLGGGS
jgi:outer membrane protein